MRTSGVNRVYVNPVVGSTKRRVNMSRVTESVARNKREPIDITRSLETKYLIWIHLCNWVLGMSAVGSKCDDDYLYDTRVWRHL